MHNGYIMDIAINLRRKNDKGDMFATFWLLHGEMTDTSFIFMLELQKKVEREKNRAPALFS